MRFTCMYQILIGEPFWKEKKSSLFGPYHKTYHLFGKLKSKLNPISSGLTLQLPYFMEIVSLFSNVGNIYRKT
jgi:hypothetical protein